ncbi:uncharacterized protein [Nicotiana tomentosiformis]|uniref:uncharacterized protein n=1 Tax=Nicotiana tomentosiformis TaxID=4098 RepID=UPI00388C8BA8
MIQGGSGIDTTDQVSHYAYKLNVLASAIDVEPLYTLPPTSAKPLVEKFMVEEHTRDLGKEKEEEVVISHEEHVAQNIVNKEGKSENGGVSGDEKESDTQDKTGEQANNSAEEENHSEEEEVSESEGEDQEQVDESEEGNDESEKEEGNESEESEGSMTIGNTVIASSEEIGEETRAQEPGSLLAPFTGDEEVSSDEDDVPLSEVGKKLRKTTEKATKTTILTRNKVVPSARTPLTRSKRKFVDEQIMKESRSAKKRKKKASIVEPVVEVDGEDESHSSFLAKSTTPKKRGAKVTKPATSSARASRGKTRKNISAAVDRLIEFRNRKILNGKILANIDEKGMAQLVEKLEL